MRSTQRKRETKETQISLSLTLDGTGGQDIRTGIPFFDHLVEILCRYMNAEATLVSSGDLAHHLVEDVGIVFGEALRDLYEQDKKIRRFSDRTVPMDDALVQCAIDFAGRPYLGSTMDLSGQIEAFDLENVQEFLQALVNHGRFNLHLRPQCGMNKHHIAEAAFKGLGLCLSESLAQTDALLSTKGALE